MHLVTWSYNFAGYSFYVLYCYSLLAEFSRLCRSLPIHTHLLFSSLLNTHLSISLAASTHLSPKIKESVKKYALLSLNFLLQCNHNPYASIRLRFELYAACKHTAQSALLVRVEAHLISRCASSKLLKNRVLIGILLLRNAVHRTLSLGLGWCSDLVIFNLWSLNYHLTWLHF